MGLFSKIFGDVSSRALAEAKPFVEAVNALEPAMQELRDEDFPVKTTELKQRLQSGVLLDDIAVEAFALVREAAVRTLGLRHYDVQIIGGYTLHKGMIAEMRTGEGKTLVATLPVYLNALSGRGVHVVTVNDYLAKRDVQWMGQVYAFLGLSAAVVTSGRDAYLYDETYREDTQQGTDTDEDRDETGSFKVFDEYLRPAPRKDAYAADITYGTNNGFGFDYLRDNIQTVKEGIVQRDHAFAIVDEIDSVLIDEARVPLILSAQAEDSEEQYIRFAAVARMMIEGEDYTLDEKLKAIEIKDAGITKAEKTLGIDNLYTQEGIRFVHHLETALRAQAAYQKDRDYVIKDGNVLIVDPFTGRTQEGRRWSEGLHQAIEAKEGVAIQRETVTSASITYQNYFKLYDKLSGMTGTAATSSEEFYKVYNLDVVEIPTNKPIARIDESDYIFVTEEGKFKAIVQKVKELQDKGQPVLVGTASVEKSEMLSKFFLNEGIRHDVLNAKNHESEGQVIAQAGKRGSVVIATNMAGRGVDIKLGGNPGSSEEAAIVKKLGGLYVLGTERHDSRRIDNQLRGRSGRQGDPGETQFYVSMDDSLMRVFGSDRVKSLVQTLKIPEDQPIKNKMISNGLERAQEKIEGFHFDQRKHVLEFDDVLSHQRNTVYARRRKILFEDEDYTSKLLGDVMKEAADEQISEIERKKGELGDETFFKVFRRVSLQVIDTLWREHLQVMDYTRQSVNLRAYGQREPIVEYKKEGLRLFREMEATFRSQIAHYLSMLDVEALRQQLVVARQKAQERTMADQTISDTKMGRNDKLIVTKGGKRKEIKFKKLGEYLKDGWVIKES